MGYDGALGLGTPWKNGLGESSVLSALMSHDMLDEPIFSLKLPHYEGEEGELLLGAFNPALRNSAITQIPVINATSDNYFPDRWTVPASAIHFASPHPLHVSLPSDGYALLDTALPYLILPSAMARNLTAAVGAQRGPYWFHNIPCARRQELPALTFTLGEHNFSISAFEYTIEIDELAPHVGRMCIATFMEADDFFPPNWNGIVLGNPFLRGFYSVWNMEKREVGCKCWLFFSLPFLQFCMLISQLQWLA